jgi:hypothetical protein
LTPEQLFEHRLAALLGRSLGELDELPAREIERWFMYWSEEPWGAVRDNMHAALIVSELLRPHLKEGTTVTIGDFMFRHKEDRDAIARGKLVANLTAMAARAERAQRRLPPAQRRLPPARITQRKGKKP